VLGGSRAFASAHCYGQGVDWKPSPLTQSFVLVCLRYGQRGWKVDRPSAYPIPYPQMPRLLAPWRLWRIGSNRVLLGMESDTKAPPA
jgi:hypothetical protein